GLGWWVSRARDPAQDAEATQRSAAAGSLPAARLRLRLPRDPHQQGNRRRCRRDGLPPWTWLSGRADRRSEVVRPAGLHSLAEAGGEPDLHDLRYAGPQSRSRAADVGGSPYA